MFVQRTRWSNRAVGTAVAVGVVFVVLTSLPGLVTSGSVRVVALTVAAVMGLLFGLVLLTFTTLVVKVNDVSVTVSFGPFRQRVLISTIADCRATPYDWRRWGGFGIRGGRRHKLYNVAGDGGTAVQITRDDGSRLLFSSRDPEAVCRAVGDRRSAL